MFSDGEQQNSSSGSSNLFATSEMENRILVSSVFLKHDLNIRCLKCRHVHKKRALSIYSILQWFCMYQNLKDEVGDIRAMQPLCQVGLRGGDHGYMFLFFFNTCILYALRVRQMWMVMDAYC